MDSKKTIATITTSAILAAGGLVGIDKANDVAVELSDGNVIEFDNGAEADAKIAEIETLASKIKKAPVAIISDDLTENEKTLAKDRVNPEAQFFTIAEYETFRDEIRANCATIISKPDIDENGVQHIPPRDFDNILAVVNHEAGGKIDREMNDICGYLDKLVP